ncbi:MAG: ABC transporter substrate-binding protein, partial [Acidimicrobiaceae bacterium]|nr:ABC transporter substrate-binding protein [Acidimicrobiaceae bacterium]
MGVSRVPKVLRVPELRCHRLLLAAVAMVLFLAACSEPATDDAGNNQDDSTDVPATGSDDADDTGNEDTDDADASTAAAPAAPGESNAPADTGTTAAPATPGPSDDGSIVWQHRGEPWFLGTIPSAAVAADMSAEPIKIGMINQEDTPIGSFPEVRFAAEAAINWINAELGGVDGRPLEFHWCITPFSPEQSQVCAQEMVQEGVVALV